MAGQFEQIASGVIVCLIMLGMGATLTLRDFIESFRQPTGIFVGLFSQYAVMPFVGFALISLLPLTEGIAVGVLIMACMPGGTTSNMFTYFARGNVALSILMTVNSTILGIFLIPLSISIYAAALDLSVPSENIILVLLVVLIPIGVGMMIRHLSKRAAVLTEKFGAGIGIVFIIFVIGNWVPRNLEFLQETSVTTYFAATALGAIGIIVGYTVAKILRLNSKDARTVAIETGLQNGPLAFAIIALTFSGTEQNEYITVPALYTAIILVVASIAVTIFRYLDRD